MSEYGYVGKKTNFEDLFFPGLSQTFTSAATLPLGLEKAAAGWRTVRPGPSNPQTKERKAGMGRGEN